MQNYFNYFTEIEECYQRCRGTRTLLSPLDWALIESWKEAGLPLPVVMLGIERAFEKFKARPRKYRLVNSLAYCSQEVVRAAEEARTAEVQEGTTGAPSASAAPFPPEEVRAFVLRNAAAVERARQTAREGGQQALVEDLAIVAAELRGIAEREVQAPSTDLEQLESRFSVLEDKLTASLTRAASVDLLARFRSEIDRGLAPSRRKMTALQIESLERQFLKKRLFEHHQVPRLSLFYL